MVSRLIHLPIFLNVTMWSGNIIDWIPEQNLRVESQLPRKIIKIYQKMVPPPQGSSRGDPAPLAAHFGQSVLWWNQLLEKIGGIGPVVEVIAILGCNGIPTGCAHFVQMFVTHFGCSQCPQFHHYVAEILSERKPIWISSPHVFSGIFTFTVPRQTAEDLMTSWNPKNSQLWSLVALGPIAWLIQSKMDNFVVLWNL